MSGGMGRVNPESLLIGSGGWRSRSLGSRSSSDDENCGALMYQAQNG